MAAKTAFCQCCGDEQAEKEMMKLCLHCTQAKFVPRGQWEYIGFQGAYDGRTSRGWWDKIACNNAVKIREACITKAKEIEARQSFMALFGEEEDEEEIDLL